MQCFALLLNQGVPHTVCQESRQSFQDLKPLSSIYVQGVQKENSLIWGNTVRSDHGWTRWSQGTLRLSACLGREHARFVTPDAHTSQLGKHVQSHEWLSLRVRPIKDLRLKDLKYRTINYLFPVLWNIRIVNIYNKIDM